MSKSSSNSTSYDFFAETMTCAADELWKRHGQKQQIRTKPDSSLVTEADLASEKIILDRIRRSYSDDLILSEEAGLSATGRKSGSHIWIIDPLDGTTNFANGYPFYCVSVARGRFLANGKIEIVAGGVYDVPRRNLYYAELGKGAKVDGKALQVAVSRDFAQCFLCTGFYYKKGEDLEKEIRRFSHVAEHCQAIRRDGAAALDLALVAAGIFDAFWESGLAPWDVAAGSLLVAEAGGKVCNYPQKSPAFYDIEDATVIAGSATATAAIAKLV